jgi:hypothetical protein
MKPLNEFLNEGKSIDFYDAPKKMEKIKKEVTSLFGGHPVKITIHDVDGFDYNKLLKVVSTNMGGDKELESVIRNIEKTKFPGLGKNAVDVRPNFGSGLTLTIRYWDESAFVG